MNASPTAIDRPAGVTSAPERPANSRLAALRHRYGYPLLALTRRHLERAYGGTSLGRGLMVLQPAILLALYIVVFGFVLKVKIGPNSGPGDFAIFLMSGMLPYLALADGIQRASTSLGENRSLLDQAVFPAEVIPLASVLSASFTDLIGMLILAAVAAGLGQSVTMWLLLMPLMLLLRIALTFGIGSLVSVLTVFIPDLRELLGFLLTVWMFLTPIFYLHDAVPQWLRISLEFNPLHHLVAAYRAVLFSQPGAAIAFMKAAAWCLSLMLAGGWFFRKAITRARDLL